MKSESLDTDTESTAPAWPEAVTLINNAKRQLQFWRSHPPHALGLLITFLVAAEVTVALRFTSGRGAGRSLFSEIAGQWVLISAASAYVAFTAHRIGALFSKKGSRLATWTLLNLSTLPLLLFLPGILAIRALDLPGIITLAWGLVLVAKVLSQWREAVQISYRLTLLQSYLIGLALGGLLYVLISLAFLFGAFGALSEISDLLSQF